MNGNLITANECNNQGTEEPSGADIFHLTNYREREHEHGVDRLTIWRVRSKEQQKAYSDP